jgi:phosphohistidine phosphatase
MKTLIIIRHAKSDWDNPHLRDFDRPLNGRGMRDAPFMGEQLALKHIKPDYILCSPALRTKTTASIIAEKIGIELSAVITDDKLYLADADTLVDVLRVQSPSIQTLALVGHNPGITDLVNRLGKVDIDNVPTCGILIFNFNSKSWESLGQNSMELISFDYPKKFSRS